MLQPASLCDPNSFATGTVSVQVIFTVIGAIPLFGQYPSYYFLLGALLVSLSVGMYGTTAEQSAVFYAACVEACREPAWMLELRKSEGAERWKTRCEASQDELVSLSQPSLNGAARPSLLTLTRRNSDHTQTLQVVDDCTLNPQRCSQVSGTGHSGYVLDGCSGDRARMHGHCVAHDSRQDEIGPAVQQ